MRLWKMIRMHCNTHACTHACTHTHTHRKQKKQLWEKSCQWIATHESRVRVENRPIAGEDFQVWRWIQVRGEESGRGVGEWGLLFTVMSWLTFMFLITDPLVVQSFSIVTSASLQHNYINCSV